MLRTHEAGTLRAGQIGQTGTIADLYRYCGIDAQGIMAAAQSVSAGRPLRHLGSAA